MNTSTAAYWTNRDAAHGRDTAEAAAYAASYTGRLEAAHRRLNLVTGDLLGFTDADRADAFAAIAALETEAEAAFAATWTREVTQARRATWNAAVALHSL